MSNPSHARLEGASKKYRFWELDFLRGICVLLMVFDHIIQLMAFSDSGKLWDIFDAYMSSSIQNFFHPIIRAVFFLICGVSCVLSRSNFKRGTQLFGVACALTFATALLSTTSQYFYGITILFGVLHMLAISILYYAILSGFSAYIPRIGAFVPAIIGVLCIIFFYAFIQGKEGDFTLGALPSIVGFEVDYTLTADHSPLFPEMGYVLIGSALGQFYKSKYKYVLRPLDGKWNKPVCFIGKHALIIYLLHPIIIGGLYSFF